MSAHVSERMSAYVDRELPPADRAGVDAHLRECPDCARAVEEMRALDALARGQEVQAPEGYFDALPGRVRGRLAPRAHARVPPWTLALAAGLAVALLAPLALRRAPPPSAREAASGPAAPLSTSSSGPREREPFPPAAPAPAAPAVGARAAQDLSAEGTARRERSTADAEGRAEPKGRREEMRPGPDGTPSAGRFGEAAPASARAAGGADRSMPEARRQVASGQEWPSTPGPEVAEAEEEEDAPALVSDDSAPPRRAAKSVTAAPVPRAGVAPPPAGVDARLRSLSSRTMRSAAEARELRDAWEAFVREDPEGPHADDARLRALEAGAAAWGLGGQRDDRARVEKDAREYLRRAQGAHKERVRALLAGLQP